MEKEIQKMANRLRANHEKNMNDYEKQAQVAQKRINDFEKVAQENFSSTVELRKKHLRAK